jgi:hypothetical protein
VGGSLNIKTQAGSLCYFKAVVSHRGYTEMAQRMDLLARSSVLNANVA